MIVDGIASFSGGNHVRPIMQIIEDIQSFESGDSFHYRHNYELDEYVWLKHGEIAELDGHISSYFRLKELLGGKSGELNAARARYRVKFGYVPHYTELYKWVKGGEYGEDLALSSQQESRESSVPIRKADL